MKILRQQNDWERFQFRQWLYPEPRRSHFDAIWIWCIAGTAAILAWGIYTILNGATPDDQLAIRQAYRASEHAAFEATMIEILEHDQHPTLEIIP